MLFQDLAYAFDEQYAVGTNEISGSDLSALQVALYGAPSVRGRTPVDVDALKQIAAGGIASHVWGMIDRGTDPVAAAQWALGLEGLR